MSRKALVIGLLALVSTAGVGSGCGYSFVRYDGGLGQVRSVAVPTLRNDSYESGIENVVSNALRREFLRRKGVRLVENPHSADLVLSGRVLPIRARSQSFSSVLLALEYEVTLSLELQATREDGSEIPLDPTALRDTERYLASADVEALRKNREEALRRLSSLLAARIYDSLYESLR